MNDAVITVEARIIGQRKPLIAGRQISLALPPADGPGGGELRLRDLLSQTVRQEVQHFAQRQEEQRLIRVLSPAEIARGVAAGKVTMGGAADRPAAQMDEDAAVAVALQAFTDSLYFVFLDGQHQLDLDAVVSLRPASHLAFIRLVALAGG